MSRYHPGSFSASRGANRTRLGLVAGVTGLLLCGTANAQETSGLRGAVEERATTGSLLQRSDLADRSTQPESQQQQGIPSPRYRPESTGALTDQALDDALGVEPPADDMNVGESGAGRQNSTRSRRSSSRARNRRSVSDARRTEDASQEMAADGNDPAAPDPTTTATIRAATIDSLDEERNQAADRQNERIDAIEGADPVDEDDPYAPVGIRAGTFILRPSLEQGFEYSSNADSSTNGDEAVFSETTLRLEGESDWSRHSANFSAFGIFRKTISGADFTEPEAGIDADLIFDLINDWRVLASGGYQVARESATAPVDFTGTTNRPLAHELVGSLGVEKTAGRFLFRLTGEADRLFYGDAELSTGGTATQSDRNQTLATIALRAGYEVAPAIIPFVEIEAGRRLYDETFDRNGFQRSSKRLGLRAGAAIDLQEKLTGELSAGWVQEDSDDARLGTISGATIDGNLTWSPSRRTAVSLLASTTVEGTTTAGANGSVLYNGSVGISHQIRANLTGNAAFGAAWRDFSGSNAHDLTLSAELGFTYWLNRSLGIVGRARHETVTSSDANSEYKTNSAYLGMRWQR